MVEHYLSLLCSAFMPHYAPLISAAPVILKSNKPPEGLKRILWNTAIRFESIAVTKLLHWLSLCQILISSTSLMQWLSDRKKRQLQKKDVGEFSASQTVWFISEMYVIILTFLFTPPPDIQRRIELIQDFEMPTVCTSIKVSRDGQFILAAGETSCG